MKKVLGTILAEAIVVAVAGCSTVPTLTNETKIATPTAAMKSVLIEINESGYDNFGMGRSGRDYMEAMGTAFRGTLPPDIPARIISIDGMALDNPEGRALDETHPNYIMRLHPLSISTVQGTSRTVWQLDVSQVTIAQSVTTGPHGKPITRTHYTIRPVYRSRANGRVVREALLVSAATVRQRGAEMGKTLGEALNAAQVLGVRDPS